ncbi:hypothetical protein AUJ66_02365 [Candidatus Desantisbacteria bacterium CG1_02_38_46]|uniref:Na+/H+ antiporter subunit E n=2 Tax=unclassified Candidatus Desantisiibacteriota TaxID=3106372 RepID=A0A1J4SGH7_9BACT|nr:MAG: hypothetical protein AUJ66_02365 [Candidatus Desantisbacteria bacterium CG1_02_38_46]PIU52238.1 MAG: Na+/H+ antiporter subunit E [Candidatus Desantisbacteria bacterium CG07_land_8_20_14_0_80_39_15]
MKMSKFVLFVILFLLWLLLTWTFNYQDVTIGLILSLFIAILMGDIFTEHPGKFKDIKRYLWMIAYIPYFFWYCILANFDVAYRVLHPKMPIKPGIVKVKTNLKSDAGRTFLANSITLTPGTLSVDITDEGYLYVHWINVKTIDIEEASKEIVAKFEYFLKHIYE